MAVINIYDRVPAMVAAAALDSNPAAQTGRASMPRFIQVSIEVAVSDRFFLGQSGFKNTHSLSFAVERYQEEAGRIWIRYEK